MRHLIVAVFLAIMLLPVRASAQPPNCGDHEEIVGTLTEKYDEAVIGTGNAPGRVTVELLASPGGETWTLILTDQRGWTCYITTGLDWKITPMPESGKRL